MHPRMPPPAISERKHQPGETADDYRYVVAQLSDGSAREIRFCDDMRGILNRWPPKPKQAAWLRSLVAKMGGRFDG